MTDKPEDPIDARAQTQALRYALAEDEDRDEMFMAQLAIEAALRRLCRDIYEYGNGVFDLSDDRAGTIEARIKAAANGEEVRE